MKIMKNKTHPVEKCVGNIATSIHIQLSSLCKTDYESSLQFKNRFVDGYKRQPHRGICVAVVVRAAG